jgi:hypothetical protein
MGDQPISACGLTCTECDAYMATQRDDSKAASAVAAKWSQLFDASVPEDAVWCDGCMTGGERISGYAADCDIRTCVIERGHRTCADCDDYICDRLERFLTMAGGSRARETLMSLRAQR